jgi:DNA ligase-1
MLFASLVAVFERIEHQSSRLEMMRELSELFLQSSPHEAQIISYLSLGVLYPVFISTAFNLAQKTLSPVLQEFSGVSHAEWASNLEFSGDLGSTFERSSGLLGGGELTVVEAYDALVEIEKVTGNGSKEKKIALLLALLSKCSKLEAKFIVRIIVGVLRLGFSEMTIIDALSWMLVGNKSHTSNIEAAFNVCADIGLVTYQLKTFGLAGIEHLSVTPGVPVRPAAAERMNSPEDIFNKLGVCYSQPKLDGFRLQVHKYVDEEGVTQVTFFSRNLQEKSDVFPELTASVKKLSAESFIAEGEAITYDVNTGIFLPFQETAKRGRKNLDQSVVDDFPLKLFLFDVLYLNGTSLLDLSHEQRRKVLTSFLDGGDGTVLAIGETRCESAHDVDLAFTQALSEGLEGVVIKKGDTPYTPGKRNFNWIKLKRKETGELNDTLDCVILGYYWGQGHRSSLGIGAVLLGVYNNKTDCFESIARCGSGPTESEWRSLKQQCDARKIHACPQDVLIAHEHTPDVWVDPVVVVAVRADELTRSPLHRAGKSETSLGFALRFPRIMDYRFDKSAHDATTVVEVVRLCELQNKKFSA